MKHFLIFFTVSATLLGLSPGWSQILDITSTPGMPTIGFASTYASGLETESPVRVRVVLDQPSSNDVTVNYTATGSAHNGADYSLADSTLTIPAGTLSASINFPVVNDTTIDGDETVKIILMNPQNAVLGQNIFTYVIKNDDASPTASQPPPLLTMSPIGARSIALNLSRPYNDGIASVGYQITLTQTGSNLNYTLGSGTVTFQSGQSSATLDIPEPTNDIDVPGIKTITVFLNNPMNLAIDIPMYSFSY